MDIQQLHVVVVGAGIGGAAAALLFARAGARVSLVERVAQPRAIGAGLGIADNGFAVLESVGLGPAVANLARTVPSPRLVDGRGRELLRMRGPVPRVQMIRRSDLQEVLLDAVAAESRITTHFGAEVSGTDLRGTVELRTSTGPTSLRGDLVIAADGVHSRLRACGDHGAKLARPGIAYLRAIVDGPDSDPRHEEAWTSAGLFGSFAVRDGTYLFASAGSRATQEAIAQRDLPRLAAIWRAAYPAGGEILARVRHFDDLIINQVQRVRCARWSDGAQVLIGDAAHAMAPNLGQGANSALVDAAVLLDELTRAASLAPGLVAYQARRQVAVARVARAADQLGLLAEITNPVTRWLRDRVVIPILNVAPGVPSEAMMLQEPVDTLLAIGRA